MPDSQIPVFHLAEGDVILVRVDGRLSAEVRDAMSRDLGAAYPSNRVILADSSTVVEVMRPAATPLTDAAEKLVDDLSASCSRWLPGDTLPDGSIAPPRSFIHDGPPVAANTLKRGEYAFPEAFGDNAGASALAYDAGVIAGAQYAESFAETIPRPGYTLTDLARMRRTETTTSTVRNGLGEVVEETIIHHPATAAAIVRASEDLEDEDLADLAERDRAAAARLAEAELMNLDAAYTSAAKEWILARHEYEQGIAQTPERVEAALDNLEPARVALRDAAKAAGHTDEEAVRLCALAYGNGLTAATRLVDGGDR
jgi:hypothetical protein